MIAIIDYGAGNLRSVQNAFAHLGAEFEIVRDSAVLRHAEKIVLPGVGHFGQMMTALDTLGLRESIREHVKAGVPFLGVCLGMQALFEQSAEAPGTIGLGIFRGVVERFSTDSRVPHMGWNEIATLAGSRCLTSGYFYFAHSYYVPLCDEAVALCNYSHKFTAAVEKGSCFGVQFHPEKSGEAGLEILRRFAEL